MKGVEVEIRVLGPVSVVDESGESSLTPQLRRLLGALVVADGSFVSSDRLGDHLAVDGPADGSVVRTSISRLRKVLGDRVETSSGGYRLRVASGELDSAEFLRLCEEARVRSSGERVDCLQQALSLWHGAAFGEVAEEEWARPTAVHLDETRAVAVEDLAEALIECAQPARAVVLLEPHLVEHPYRERPVGLVMRALADDGRVADALRAYQRLRVTIREDLGLDPTAELRRLESELLGGLDPVRVMSAPLQAPLPTGTVTFMFTDIEGSTSRWQDDEVAMSAALAGHDDTIRTGVEDHGGVVFKHTGDGICAVFSSAPSAIDAAIEIQSEISLPVRIGLHTGEAEQRSDDYFGPTLNRTARVMDAGNGGQILVSAATLSLSPGHDFVDHGHLQLKGLDTPEHVFQVGHHEFPPLRVVRDVAGNLPTELTSFVGRTVEVGATVETLVDHRLVTLIGVGGTGKTRLAVESARQMAPMFPDGCWLVELASVAVPEAVPFAFAEGLDITLPQQTDVVDVIVAHLRHRRAVVIVDNCEHLLAAAGDVIERIAAECASVAVLSTSREPLMLNGEYLVPVAPLAPTDAAQLFEERARAESPDLILDDVQAEAVQALCARLDGLPLAVELAASRIRAFTPVELLSLLDERFGLLVGGRRSRMERHQTMRGTLDWSYDLCDQTEQTVFDRLSIFAATFDLGDARAVASGDGLSELGVIDTVPRLVDRSLLQRTVAEDGTTRYRMLETMRAYGREHLKLAATLDTAWRRYSEYVARTVGLLSVTFIGPDEEQKITRLNEYVADEIVALDWLIDHREWNLAARIASRYGRSDRVSQEIGARLHDALIASGDEPPEAIVIAHRDSRILQTATMAELSEAGWQALRSDELVPNDWMAWPAVLGSHPMTVSEAKEVFRALSRYSNAPPYVRAVANWSALQASLERGLDGSTIEGYAESRSDLYQLVAETRSSRVEGLLLDIRAFEARRAGRYAEAAEYFTAASATGNPVARSWWYLRARWNAVLAQVMSGGSVGLGQVADLWALQVKEKMVVLNFRGALVTAMALDAANQRPLAERFIAWLHCDGPDGFVAELFPNELNRFGDLDATETSETGSLEELLAAFERIAVGR